MQTKSFILLFNLFFFQIAFSQTAGEYLVNYKNDIEGEYSYTFKNYKQEIIVMIDDIETGEIKEITSYEPLNFKIDNTRNIKTNKSLIAIPVNCYQYDDFGNLLELRGFYVNLIKKDNVFNIVSIIPPFTHYFSNKNKDGKVILKKAKYNYVNYLPNQYHQQLTTTYTNQEIETHYSNLLNEYMSLMDSNYLCLDGQEFTDTLVLEFFVENSYERKFNHDDKIIHQHVKAYNDLENLQYWGNLFEMNDDFSLNAQLREKQEKLVAQDFTLVFKYDNSFPKPIFELIKIIPPPGLEWEPITETKYLLQLDMKEK